MASSTVTAAQAVSRVAASLLGGYAFTWGFTSAGIAVLLAAGLRYDEAHTLVMLLAFGVYLGVFCWAFAAASVARVWAVLAGGGAALSALAWWLARTPS